jgi:hypothetical protein
MIELFQAKPQHEGNHLSSDDLHQYINNQIGLQLSHKADWDYLQASLINLKEAWQNEEHELCLQLQDKAEESALETLRREMQVLTHKVDKIGRTIGGKGRLNSNLSFNLPTSTSTPMPSSMEKLDISQHRPKTDTQNECLGENVRKNNAFSSSLGRWGRQEDRRSTCTLTVWAILIFRVTHSRKFGRTALMRSSDRANPSGEPSTTTDLFGLLIDYQNEPTTLPLPSSLEIFLFEL